MEGLVNLFIILFAFLLLIVLPIWTTFQIDKFLKKKRVKSHWRLISYTPLLVAITLIYFSYYPLDSHYEEIYEEVTKSDFPENAKFISKYSVDPTFLEGWTLMMVELRFAEFESLEKAMLDNGYQIAAESKDDLKSQYDVSDFFDLKPNANISKVIFIRPHTYVYYGVAFLDDRKTIIVKKII
jgi:hypothetical protein